MIKRKLLIFYALLFTLGFASLSSAITASIGNSRFIINSEVGEIVEKYVLVGNVNDFPVNINVSVSGDLANNLILSKNQFSLMAHEERRVYFNISADESGTTETKIKFTYSAEGEASISLVATAIVIASGQREINLVSNCQVLNKEGALYILQNDVITSEDWCFRIFARDVTLDLNGYKVTGNGGTGVFSDGFDSINVFNGTIEKFHYGYWFNNGNNVVIKNAIIINSSGGGIWFNQGADNRIENSIIEGSSFSGIFLDGVDSTIIRNNEIKNNLGEGISLRFADKNIIEGNFIEDNNHSGIYLLLSERNEISQNTVQDNNLVFIILERLN